MSISVLFSSFFGFDGLIFLVAVGNAVVFYLARKSINELYETMHKKVYTPAVHEETASLRTEVDSMSEQQIDSMREKAVRYYTLYGTITGIFPLLGILGTVISLISMVGDTSIESGFFAALTSTFWGLVFAIAYKFLDGFLSPKLEDGERAVEVLLAKRAKEREEKEKGL